MLQIVVPANVSMFFEKVIPVIKFDALDPDWTTKVFMDFDMDGHEQLNHYVLDQMENLGYETHNSLLILGSLWIFMAVYFV